jgi:hypothetical protein
VALTGRCELARPDVVASVEVTLDETDDGPQVAGRSVSITGVQTQNEAYEAAALSGWFYALERFRSRRKSADLPSVRLTVLQIVVAQSEITTEDIAFLSAAATYRALGGNVAESDGELPQLL